MAKKLAKGDVRGSLFLAPYTSHQLEKMAMLLARSAFGARVSVSAPARMSAFSVAPVARPSASSSFLGGKSGCLHERSAGSSPPITRLIPVGLEHTSLERMIQRPGMYVDGQGIPISCLNRACCLCAPELLFGQAPSPALRWRLSPLPVVAWLSWPTPRSPWLAPRRAPTSE